MTAADGSVEDRSELVQALQQPPMQRKVVVLRHWLDLSVEETARETWADVKRGYLSFALTGKMMPEIAEHLATGDEPGAERVVFYDRKGNVLVDDRRPGKLPRDGTISIANFPSLAWWLK